jgi:hypothetical protein
VQLENDLVIVRRMEHRQVRGVQRVLAAEQGHAVLAEGGIGRLRAAGEQQDGCQNHSFHWRSMHLCETRIVQAIDTPRQRYRQAMLDGPELDTLPL